MLLFSTDIDGTVYDGPESASMFSKFWNNLDGLPNPPLLTYNTGRSIGDTRRLLQEVALPTPNYLICGVGTEIYDFDEDKIVAGWGDVLSGKWDFDGVERIVASSSPARLQPIECQNPFKNSWFWDNAEAREIQQLTAEITSSGYDIQAVYSSNRDLDILPAAANKGNALQWLANQLNIPLHEIIVAGDSGNDSAMYHVPDIRGVVVSNAEPSLIEAVRDLPVHFSSKPCAAGVIEGIFALMQSTAKNN